VSGDAHIPARQDNKRFTLSIIFSPHYGVGKSCARQKWYTGMISFDYIMIITDKYCYGHLLNGA